MEDIEQKTENEDLKTDRLDNQRPEKEQPRELVVSGQKFTHVKDRLIGGTVFVSEDNEEYLRTATSKEAAKEAELTKELFDRGFPVPEVTASGTLPDGTGYYIERAIGERIFGHIFMQETKSEGVVSDESFEEFVAIIAEYSRAQFNKDNFVPASQEDLDHIVELENVLRNNPPSLEMQPLFLEAHKKASERVLSIPFGHTQGDLNAFNILPSGVIDFELSGFGPVGYDVITNLHFGQMWPAERVVYRFTQNQINKYLAKVDRIAEECGLPKMSDFENDFLVLKAIWASSMDKESEDNPDMHGEFWKWRVDMRDWCIRQYLAGEKIDPDQFETGMAIIADSTTFKE